MYKEGRVADKATKQPQLKGVYEHWFMIQNEEGQCLQVQEIA